MKKVTLNLNNTTDLTRVVKQLCELYTVRTRTAFEGSGDDVYMISNPTTKFSLEFCTKTRESDGKNLVNWARVYGPDDVVNRFLTAVGSLHQVSSRPTYREVKLNFN